MKDQGSLTIEDSLDNFSSHVDFSTSKPTPAIKTSSTEPEDITSELRSLEFPTVVLPSF